MKRPQKDNFSSIWVCRFFLRYNLSRPERHRRAMQKQRRMAIFAILTWHILEMITHCTLTGVLLKGLWGVHQGTGILTHSCMFRLKCQQPPSLSQTRLMYAGTSFERCTQVCIRDSMEVGLVDLEASSFSSFDEVACWNWPRSILSASLNCVGQCTTGLAPTCSDLTLAHPSLFRVKRL